MIICKNDHELKVLWDFWTGEGGYSSVVPEAINPEEHELTANFGREVGKAVTEYLEAMEKVKLKAGLRAAMNVSSLGNLYLQVLHLKKFWRIVRTHL